MRLQWRRELLHRQSSTDNLQLPRTSSSRSSSSSSSSRMSSRQPSSHNSSRRTSTSSTALPPLAPEADGTRYAIEIRNASLLTPRFIRALAALGVRYCVGLHARMPDPLRQAAALALLDGDAPGPLIVRWSLHGGFKYEQAKAKYEPFDKLVDEDPATRSALAELAARYALAGQPVIITINNKAEGSAPLSCIALAREIAAACAHWRNDAAQASGAA